mmetsp:Transcript_85991/g.256490  ORF Transcript_85991/g.256490 Transcript_85991/m.256490 type:complete len:477 (-) Transcript_85991:2397-3827(-)
MEEGAALLHELVPAGEVVHADGLLREALPTRRLPPGRHAVVGATEELQAHPRGQPPPCGASGAEAALAARVDLEVASQQRHDVLCELGRLGHLGRRKGILCQLLVRHGDGADGGGVHCGRPPAGDVERQRRRRPARGEPQRQVRAEASAHREADENVLRALQVRHDGVADCVQQALVLGLSGRHGLVRARTSSRQLQGDDLEGSVGLLGPRREEGCGAARKGEAVRADGGLLRQPLPVAHQQPRRWSSHRSGGGAALGELRVGRRCRLLHTVDVDGALRIRPERGPVEGVRRQAQELRKLCDAQDLRVQRLPVHSAAHLPEPAKRPQEGLNVMDTSGLGMPRGLNKGWCSLVRSHTLCSERAQCAARADLQHGGGLPLSEELHGVVTPADSPAHVAGPVRAVLQLQGVQPAPREIRGHGHARSSGRRLLGQPQALQRVRRLRNEPGVEGLPHVQLRALPPSLLELRLQCLHGGRLA